MRGWAGVALGVLLVATTSVATAAWPVGTRPVGTRPVGAGCSRSTLEPPGVSVRSLAVDGLTREYRLAIPERNDPAAPLPLVLSFHGSGALAALFAGYSQLEEKGPRRGYVVATPQGTGPTTHWNTEAGRGPDDRRFAAALVGAIEDQLCVDPDRVYATGFSNGARLTTALACDPSTTFAAVAPVSGINLYDLCPRGRPLAVLAIHGWRDDTVPYAGGRSGFEFRPDFVTPSVPAAVRSWARRDRCTSGPVRGRVTRHVRRAAYQHCAVGTRVVLYTVIDGGHAWPGAVDRPEREVTTQEIDAAELILDFFDHHPRA